MRRALELAARGPAHGVNPRVGCVILDAAGTVIAEGWHQGAGTPHAEVAALQTLQPGAARGATAVVTLEPCNHTGRTGPCSEALIDAGVSRVVFAVSDPDRAAAGGAARLRAAAVEVIAGVLEAEASEFLGDWLVSARLGRPFITLKWASSLDGRVAAADGSSRWITGTAARQRVHEQREASDAIVVGTGTVLADNPALTARGDGGELLERQPVPVVIGYRDIPADAAVRRHPRPPVFARSHDLNALLADLRHRGIRRALVEGGPTLASVLVSAGLVDEYLIYLAPTLLGGDRTALTDIGVGTIDEQRRLEIVSIEQLGHDLLLVARPAAPTADVRGADGARTDSIRESGIRPTDLTGRA
ncbi:MAG: bifunctional diaminohydroxyphosphoribosylaminopyrimidine deaminase/5-amino-6-(5-phosphoribosylamino)uracil reductase RibD [Microbacteriaceae bacterium]|nr:MAG: bifunctional diaminohydroxyphosphoribosylaminopyrimidine deaminase/5-amino-6-(5-phosphoribosylamino)uracil reductase RibD [Microbacteriaceae bacterium]